MFKERALKRLHFKTITGGIGKIVERLFPIVAIVALLLTATGCVKNEFSVRYALPSNVNSAYTTVYYASDSKKGWVIEGVVAVQQGKAEQRCVTRLATLYYIISPGGELGAVAYVERGDKIEVSGNGAEPLEWKITGNKLTESLSDWRVAHAAAIKKARGRSQSAVKSLNKEVSDYVSSNPDNPVATLLMLLYFDRGSDEDGFIAAWSKLKGDAADPRWRELVSRNDMLEEVPSKSKLPPMIVLNSVATGCDTIVPGRVPTLLYVSRPGLTTYREDIKELSRFSREFGDSARRVIANISVEPDSSVRWNSYRGDSLTNAVQGWVPLGLSDMTLKDLGVRTVPYVIVIGKDGKAAYRGANMREAVTKMRGQM